MDRNLRSSACRFRWVFTFPFTTNVGGLLQRQEMLNQPDHQGFLIRQAFRHQQSQGQLPEALEQLLWDQVQEIEEAKKMPYVTSVERIGIEKGLKRGQLEARRETARNLLLTTDLDDITIAKVTNLSEDEIRVLRGGGGH